MAMLIQTIRDRIRGMFGAISPAVSVTIAPPAPPPVDVYAVTLSVDNPAPTVGQTIHFSGKYTKNGVAVPYYEVFLNKNGVATGGYADTDAAGNFAIPYLCNVAGSFSFTSQTTDPSGTATPTSMRWRGSVSDPVSINVAEDGEPTWPKPVRSFLAKLLERFAGE